MADLSDEIRALIQRGIAPVSFEEISAKRHGRPPPRGATVARILAVVVLVAVAVPVVVALASGRSTTAQKNSAGARHRVLAALDTTIASGSFDIDFTQQPLTGPTTPTTTSTTSVCPPMTTVPTSAPLSSSTPTTAMGRWICQEESSGTASGLTITGQGTIDTNPFAMVASSVVPGLGQVTVRADGTRIWEMGGGNYGLSPGSTDSAPGASLPGFANLVEGTLGQRQGAYDMMGLANPAGYLELDESTITSADQIGTSTVAGVPVTVYQVSLSPDQDASVSGSTPEEATAIDNALALLQQQGYTGTTVKVSIDAAGFIRQTDSVASFSDGSTATTEVTFSDFGCAGTVLMPGQQGSTAAPAGCVSPDTATAAPSTS
jgi:hypothetical protein